MSAQLLTVILAVIALNGWCESIPQNGAFIFIEIKPPFSSEDRTAKSTAVYLDEKGLVQRYACEDYQIKELQEGSLPVADIFKTLSAIPLKSLPGRQKADRDMSQPSQAHPGHTRLVVRQSGGVDYQWAWASDDAAPSPLQKLVQDSSALALKLSTAHTSGLAETLKAKKPTAGAFVRANILSADRLDEYRVFKLLKTVKTLDELDSVLQEALVHPFRMMPVPEGKNPFSAFVIKGKSSPLPLLFNGSGYEVSRYSVAPVTPPPIP